MTLLTRKSANRTEASERIRDQWSVEWRDDDKVHRVLPFTSGGETDADVHDINKENEKSFPVLKRGGNVAFP